MSSRKILMIPGPTENDPQVLSTLSLPVRAHYGVEWGEFYNETCQALKKIFKSSEEVILFPCPGSLAIDMASLNILEPGDKAVVVNNGFFGEILVESVALHEGEVISVESEYGRAVNVDDIRRVLEENRDIKAIFVSHNETSTGIINPIDKIGALSKEFGTFFVVDAVSSFGGIDIDVDRWSIDYCIGYSSKCLSSANGVTPLSISTRVWDYVDKRRKPVRSRYLSLKLWRRFIDEWGSWGHPYPSSMPTSLITALRRAVDLALQEGLENRYRRHRVVAKACREGLKALGLKPFAKEEEASSTVTVVSVPEGVDTKIREILFNKYDIMISGGLSELKGKVIRIGHMGVSADRRFIIPMLAAVGSALMELGYSVSPGDAVDVAEEVFKKLVIAS